MYLFGSSALNIYFRFSDIDLVYIDYTQRSDECFDCLAQIMYDNQENFSDFKIIDDAKVKLI